MANKKLEQARWVHDYLHLRAWRYEVKTSWLIVGAIVWLTQLAAGSPNVQCEWLRWVAIATGFAGVVFFGLVLSVPRGRRIISPAATFIDAIRDEKSDDCLYKTLTHDTGEELSHDTDEGSPHDPDKEPPSAITSMDNHLSYRSKWFHWALTCEGVSLMLGLLWFIIR